MGVTKFTVKGKHDLELACIKIEPKKAPKAIVQIFHGMGEYKDRYIPFMEFLAANGYAAYAHDHRKHGESITSEEGYGIFESSDTWNDVIDDCYAVSRVILKEHPGKPIVTLGHSMGSIINRLFVSKYNTVPKAAIVMGTLPPVGGFKATIMIMMASVVKLFTGSTKRSSFLAEQLSKPMQPKYRIPRTQLDWLSRDDALVDSYIADPLCGYEYTAQFYKEFFKGIRECNKSDVISLMKDIPVLFISGSEDPVGENGNGVKEIHRIYKGHGYLDLTLELVPEAKHEILNELDKENTYQFLLDWLNKSV